MDDNETEQPEEMTLEDFNEMADSIAKGIGDVLDSVAPKQVRYVLAVYHEGLEVVGIATNAPPKMVQDIAQNVVSQTQKQMDSANQPGSDIILPH